MTGTANDATVIVRSWVWLKLCCGDGVMVKASTTSVVRCDKCSMVDCRLYLPCRIAGAYLPCRIAGACVSIIDHEDRISAPPSHRCKKNVTGNDGEGRKI